MWHFPKWMVPPLVGALVAGFSFSVSAGPFAYVTNFNSDSVSVIDTASNTVVATVPVPASHWPNGVAVNPDGTRVYISSGAWYGGRVSVIDTATNTVIATVEVGDYQGKIALNPAGTRAYVTYTGMRTGNVSVIDTASNTVVATVPVPIPDPGGEVVYPGSVAVNPAGTRVYVVIQVGGAPGFVYVIDTASNTVVDTVAVGAASGGIAFNHTGTRAYVANPFGPSVVVIDTSTNTIDGTIPVVGGYPIFLAIAPDDTRLYVSNIASDIPGVSVIDLTSNTVVASVLVGGVPYGVAVNPAGTFAYVTVEDRNYVAVIDTRTNTVVGTVAVGAGPVSIAIGPTLVVGAIVPSASVVPVNAPLTASAGFTDPDRNATFTVNWNWGDGSSSVGTVSGSNAAGTAAANGTHVYTAPGVYTVDVQVTDNHNGVGTARYEYVVVYDPSAGFVTGGGWFTSPPGAYVPSPLLSGRANFGFVSKYQTGATVPTGNTEFNFKVANFNFKSTNYEWMVIAGAKAMYKGIGTINGDGAYRFILSAIDGQVSGGGGVDRLRIKIWSEGGGVIYDNMSGADDSAPPMQGIEGGSIVLHN